MGILWPMAIGILFIAGAWEAADKIEDRFGERAGYIAGVMAAAITASAIGAAWLTFIR